MTWQSLAEDIAAEFGDERYEQPAYVPASRPWRPADASVTARKALEARATSLLRAHDAEAVLARQRARVVEYGRAHRAELSARQRERREQRREEMGRSAMGPKPENAWRCGPAPLEARERTRRLLGG